jgi:hypothetical protein
MPEVKDPNLLALLNSGGAPSSGPISSGTKPVDVPSGYQPAPNGGLAPIPGGPADKPQETPNAPKLPQGWMWKDGIVGGEAVLIKGLPAPKGMEAASPAYSQSAIDAFDRAISTADRLKNHPGLGAAVGSGFDPQSFGSYNPISGKAFGGTNAAGFESELEAMKAQVFLPMVQSMKGMGALSNAEGDKLTAAIGSLNQNMPEAEFKASLDRIVADLKTYRDRGAPQGEQPAANPAEDALKAKFPEATRFLYSKGELVGYEDASGDFVAVVDNQPPPDGPSGGPSITDSLYAGVGDAAQSVGNMLGIVGNPLNAGINAITGSNLSTDLGQTFRDATGAPKGNALASAINQGGFSAMTGAGLANAAARGGGGYLANALASQPVQQVVGGMTAGAAVEGSRQAGAPAPVQVGAGLLGGVLGFGGANALMSAARPSTVAPVAQAAARQGVEMLPADVGGATTRRLTSAAAQAPLSAAPIAAAAERSNVSFGQATQRASQGSRLAPDDAGAVVAKAGERFNKQSRETGGRLYDRAEKMAQGVSIKAKGAISVIDEQIGELSQAKEVNAPLISALERFKADLSNNQGIKVSGMRDLRTAAQKAAYTEDMRSTPAQRVLGIVANAIGDDINAGLQQAGRGNAAQAFKTADNYWRDRVQYIDNVLEPVIGKGKSGESVLKSVEQMARGEGKGVQTLMKLMRSVDKEELSDIQATIIDRMGKATAGQQGAEGSTYSASTFLTNWNKMSGKGKAAIFPDANVRKNLNELAMIADNMKQASKYSNTSNTAGGIISQTMISGGLGMASPTALILGSGAQYLSGRALSSPRLTAWLAKVPANPQAQAAHIKRLDAIAAAEPIIANDIASIKQYLSNAPGLSQAAASDQIGEKRPIQP